MEAQMAEKVISLLPGRVITILHILIVRMDGVHGAVSWGVRAYLRRKFTENVVVPCVDEVKPRESLATRNGMVNTKYST
jgi:hypothetical protein